jgi:hypothetical protein
MNKIEREIQLRMSELDNAAKAIEKRMDMGDPRYSDILEILDAINRLFEKTDSM